MFVQRLLRSRALGMQVNNSAARMSQKYATPADDPKNWIPGEDPRVSTQDRYEDEPEPAEHDQIVAHYLKHHPMYEFRNFEDFHVDGYRHWLHGRYDYYNTETYPAEKSPWE